MAMPLSSRPASGTDAPWGKRFLVDVSGAVTVDFIVLTAAIIGLGMAAASSVWNGSTGLSFTLASSLSDAVVSLSFNSTGSAGADSNAGTGSGTGADNGTTTGGSGSGGWNHDHSDGKNH